MRFADLLHRWTGGLIGLLLALMGATGTLLLHADALFAPPVYRAQPPLSLAAIVTTATRDPAPVPDYIIFASAELPVHRVVYRDGSGRYLDRAGTVAARWHGMSERPELWLFELHRYLLLKPVGETIVGIVALSGIAFVLTGTVLWWSRRRTFALQLVPARLTRPAILRHHRNLGILAAPLLLLSFITGAAIALKPVGLALVSPWSSAAEIQTATAPPRGDLRRPAAHPAWGAMLADARRRFPDAELRLLSFPRRPGDPILVRLRQPDEWQPNGRTTLWYSTYDGSLLASRDAHALPRGAQLLDLAYPLHAAKVGGLLYRLVLTGAGLALTMLGTFAVWSFWFRRRPLGHDPATPVRYT